MHAYAHTLVYTLIYTHTHKFIPVQGHFFLWCCCTHGHTHCPERGRHTAYSHIYYSQILMHQSHLQTPCHTVCMYV